MLLSLLALGFVVAGVGFTLVIGLPSLDFTRNRLADEALRAVGLLAVVFFGACFLAIVGVALRRGPGLVIDDEGIVEHTSGMAAGRVRWEEITQIQLLPDLEAGPLVPGGAPTVGLTLADLEAHLDRLPTWRRWLVRSNVLGDWPPVVIHARLIGQDADALLALLLAERARRTSLPPLGDDPLAG